LHPIGAAMTFLDPPRAPGSSDRPLPDRILVVDDAEGIRNALGAYLQGAGYEVVSAATGGEAIARLRGDTVTLVIADVVMPGIDGLEILAHARALAPPPRVILMSAHARVEMAIEALRRGADDFLVKPFRLHEVGDRVRRLLAPRVPLESARIVTARAEQRVARVLAERGHRARPAPHRPGGGSARPRPGHR
jgi:DNA-binding response OmpR family regulator